MNNNRDFKRQNKAHTFVNGTVYNMLTHDCIKGIQSLSNTELDTPSTAVGCASCRSKKRKLDDISCLSNTAEHTNSQSCKKLLKCSTYIKMGAYEIARSDHNLMFNAFKNG